MDSSKYFKQQLAMLGRARLLSHFLLLLAVLSLLAVVLLPPIQALAMKPAGEVVSHWEHHLLQLPRFDSGLIIYLCVGAIALTWMAYSLEALVSLAETQCAELNDRK